MASPTRYDAFTEVSLRAEVEMDNSEAEELELSSFSVTYGLNAVPVAKLKVAVGSSPSASGANSTAGAHRIAESLKPRSKVTVYAKLSGVAYRNVATGAKKVWSDSEKIIFEGYLNRPGYQRQTGAASLTFTAVGWISDLAITSKFSYGFHINSVNDIFQPPVPGLSTMTNKKTYDIFAPDSVNDVWKKGIKSILLDLLEKDHTNSIKLIGPKLVGKNVFPIAALERMDNPDKIDVAPLTLSSELKSQTNAAVKFESANLVELTTDMRIGNNVFNTILNLSTSYGYALVTNAESATVVPFAGVRKKEYATVGADEYTDISLPAKGNFETLPIETLLLFGSLGFLTLKSPKGKEEKKDTSGMVGSFSVAEAGEGYGSVLIRRVPPILRDVQFGKGDAKKIFQTLPVATQNEEFSTITSTLGNAVARSMFLKEVFRERECVVSGRLRTDIAPGSYLKLEVLGANVPAYSGNNLWGCVTGVTCVFDAEGGTAGTTLTLNYLQTKSERELILGKIGDLGPHPLYNSEWSGTYLVKDLEVNGK